VIRVGLCHGHDWSSCYPWIIESALKNRHQQFVIDGEANSPSNLASSEDHPGTVEARAELAPVSVASR
jgi:hypothetical protein